MTEELSTKIENKKQDTITVNDPSFNVRYQPSQVFTSDVPQTEQSLTSTLKQKFDETTSAFSQSMDFSMQSLLKQALVSWNNFTSPDLPVDQRIPSKILNEAKGVMFLSVVKGGIGIGGMIGTGIFLARNPSWRAEWSAPCAIGVGGLQIGFNIGVEKTDHVIFIRDENIVNKFHSGIRLGGDISLSVGPLGRDTNVGLTLNDKGVVSNVSYSMSKGVYLGFALEGSVITIRNDCNEQYFGHKWDVLEILNGSAKGPFDSDFTALSKSLSDYMTPISSDSTTTFTTDNVPLKDENHPILNITSDTKNL